MDDIRQIPIMGDAAMVNRDEATLDGQAESVPHHGPAGVCQIGDLANGQVTTTSPLMLGCPYAKHGDFGNRESRRQDGRD